MISTFAEAQEVLVAFVPAGVQARPYSLAVMRELMQALGNPQNKYPVVHVAGTSGKTSTAYYVAALLQQTGQKVGLTVSPHIDQINERVQIDLVPLPETEYCKELEAFLKIINKLSISSTIKPSYFELLVAFAFWVFDRQGVDYAVVEVGMGGLLDGTNVITRPDKICIITDIGLDHTQQLGSTIQAIARQKAGIIHVQNQVFSYKQSDVVDKVISTVATAQQAQIQWLDAVTMIEGMDSLPLFQQRNFGLAIRTVDWLLQRDKLPELSVQQRQKAMHTLVPARMEKVSVGNKTIIMDGAHNEQKMDSLVQSFQQQYPGQQAAVLLSIVEYKAEAVAGLLSILKPITGQLILTEFQGQQDTPKKSIPLRVMQEAANAAGYQNVIAIISPEKAYQELLKTNSPLGIITGSFYLLNHIRPSIKSIVRA